MRFSRGLASINPKTSASVTCGCRVTASNRNSCARSVTLRSWLWAPADLMATVEADVQQRLVDKLRDELGRGYAIRFGRLHCDAKGVQLDDGVRIGWADIRCLRLEQGLTRERVEIVGLAGHSFKVTDSDVENLVIFSWLLAERGIPVVRELTRAVSAVREFTGITREMSGFPND